MTDMDAATALERARAFVAQGKVRDGIGLLRGRVSTDPSCVDNRRALAQLYRELGHPNQAGRWGLLVDGFTTAAEREHFADLLRNSEASERRLRSLLSLDSGGELPEAARWTLEKARKPREDEKEDGLVVAAIISFVSGGILALIALVVVFVMALFDSSATQSVAIGGLVGVMGLWALGALALLANIVRHKIRVSRSAHETELW